MLWISKNCNNQEVGMRKFLKELKEAEERVELLRRKISTTKLDLTIEMNVKSDGVGRYTLELAEKLITEINLEKEAIYNLAALNSKVDNFYTKDKAALNRVIVSAIQRGMY